MEKILLEWNSVALKKTEFDGQYAYSVTMNGDLNGSVYGATPKEALEQFAVCVMGAFDEVVKLKEQRIVGRVA
jgi:hypothetical protein